MKKIIITIREFLTQAVIIHKVITHILYAYRKGYNIYTYGQLDMYHHSSLIGIMVADLMANCQQKPKEI